MRLFNAEMGWFGLLLTLIAELNAVVLLVSPLPAACLVFIALFVVGVWVFWLLIFTVPMLCLFIKTIIANTHD